MKIMVFGLAFLLAGCAIQPQKPGKGGTKITPIPGGQSVDTSFQQPENPAQAAKQDVASESTTELPIPVGSTVVETTLSTNAVTQQPQETKRTITLAAPTTMRTSAKTQVSSNVGAAQKDMAREIQAKLASARPVQYIGVVLVLAALAMFYPPIRAVTMSTTLQAVTGAVGLFLIFAPMIIVGNEGLLIGLGIAIPTGWFLVHRHGRLQGLVDANKDGIDDRVAELVDQMKLAKDEAGIQAVASRAASVPGGTAAVTQAAAARRTELKI